MALSTAEMFDMMSGAVDEGGPSLVRRIQDVIKFDISGAGAWLVDLKNGKGCVKRATPSDKADLTISLSEETFCHMMESKLTPQQAFMKGLIKVKGTMGLGFKLNVVLAATRNYIKNKNVQKKLAVSAAAPAAPIKLNSKTIFRLLEDVVVKDGREMTKKVKGSIQFDINGAGKWHLDLKSTSPALTEGSKQADVTITVADADFVEIAMGKLNAQQAFVKGKLKIKGNMMLAMKLPIVFSAIKPQSKL